MLMYFVVRSQMVLFGYVWSCMVILSYAQFFVLVIISVLTPFLRVSKILKKFELTEQPWGKQVNLNLPWGSTMNIKSLDSFAKGIR